MPSFTNTNQTLNFIINKNKAKKTTKTTKKNNKTKGIINNKDKKENNIQSKKNNQKRFPFRWVKSSIYLYLRKKVQWRQLSID